jgi:hypothetical protein
LTLQLSLLKKNVGAATDAGERGAPHPVPEWHEGRENRLQTLGPALDKALEQSACDLRAALNELALRQQLEDLTPRLGGREVPQCFGCGAGQPLR